MDLQPVGYTRYSAYREPLKDAISEVLALTVHPTDLRGRLLPVKEDLLGRDRTTDNQHLDSRKAEGG